MSGFLAAAAAANYQIPQHVIDEIAAEANAVNSGINFNIHGPSQYGHAQNVNRPRAATTMNLIEEEAMEVALMSNTNAIIGGQHNYHGEAPLPEQCHNLHTHKAAVTARPTEQSDNGDDERMSPMMRDVIRRSKSLIANAAQHEHNQDVPACTDNYHNKYCGSGKDLALMEYAHLRSLGVIPERPYEHWGCDGPERTAHIETYMNHSVKVAFRPVDWQSEYTGRGLTKKSMEQPDDIGPRNEIEPSNASPLQIQRRRRQTPKVFQYDKEDSYESCRPDFLDNDVVGHFGEGLVGQCVAPTNDTTPPNGLPSARETSTQDLSTLFAKTARAGLELLEKEINYDHDQTTPPNPAICTSETTYSQRNKRRREPTEDLGDEEPKLDGSVPRSKRLKTSGSNTDAVLGRNENRHGQYPHINGPSKRVRGLLDRLTTIDTGAATYDGRAVKREHNDDNDAEGINVRPTYAEEDPEEEENEAEEIVVMDMKAVNSSSISLVNHGPKEWTDEERECLRLWVQDYGVTNWKQIAWCLKRSEAECKLMCCYLIMVLNQRAGRHIYAGMREDLLSTLPSPVSAATSASPAQSASPTPSASLASSATVSPASPSPVPFTSPTITARSLRPRTRQAAPKLQCGEIVYDTKARSLPKLAKNGTVVDNKGNVVVAWSGEVALALKVPQPRRKAGQKSRLTVRPQMENEPGNAPTIDRETREVPAAKSYGSGAWRYGASRRAGNCRH